MKQKKTEKVGNYFKNEYEVRLVLNEFHYIGSNYDILINLMIFVFSFLYFKVKFK